MDKYENKSDFGSTEKILGGVGRSPPLYL